MQSIRRFADTKKVIRFHTTVLSSSEGTFFNKSKASLWEQTVPSPWQYCPIFQWGWVYQRQTYRNYGLWTYFHINDDLSTKNPNLLIYSKELEIMETTTLLPFHIFLTFTLILIPTFKTKQTTSIFAIIKIPQIDSYILIPSAYGVHIPQLIAYVLDCTLHSDIF